MASPFNLIIRTPDVDIYSGAVHSLRFESEGRGTMQVLAHHATITTTLKFSPVRVEMENGKQNYIARNGLFMFNNDTNSALLLVLHCEEREKIDHKTAEEYLAFINERLAKGQSLSEFQVVYLQGEKVAVEQQLQMVKK